MGIYCESRLIVGCYYDNVGAKDELSELINIYDIGRFATCYDADDSECYFGDEVSAIDILSENGLDNVREQISRMNGILETDKCTLLVVSDWF